MWVIIMFTWSHLNTPIDHWDSTCFPNYFTIIIFMPHFRFAASFILSSSVKMRESILHTRTVWNDSFSDADSYKDNFFQVPLQSWHCYLSYLDYFTAESTWVWEVGGGLGTTYQRPLGTPYPTVYFLADCWLHGMVPVYGKLLYASWGNRGHWGC